ncbi:MAG: cupin domain-containing protein [Pseudonocardiales bacterium]
MEKFSLTALAREQLVLARQATSGRSAHTVYGGHEHVLRQTLIALAAGQKLNEHENPGEATIHVLRGRVRLGGGGESWEGSAGDLLVVPDAPHDLTALEDSVVILTVAKLTTPTALVTSRANADTAPSKSALIREGLTELEPGNEQ